MLIITGAYGFIGYNLVKYLETQLGRTDLILVDSPAHRQRLPLLPASMLEIDREGAFGEEGALEKLMAENQIEAVFHLGARTDTTELDTVLLDRLNTAYTKEVWRFCTRNGIPLMYASSAATYGAGEHGYSDELLPEVLTPLNPYGISKNDFDQWALTQQDAPPSWYGFKFFNVYGPYETHKDRMASVAFHGRNQIKSSGILKLFKSHKPEYEDGGQLRDFIYVQDVIETLVWFWKNIPTNGIYNLGTGQARSFYDLGKSIFNGLGYSEAEHRIAFVDMPEDLRERYQYFTEADLRKLRSAGYSKTFTTLEDGVKAYMRWLEAQDPKE